ncbi:hypothetical protein ACFQV8_39640 [Pseudonocardia benzenivorans]
MRTSTNRENPAVPSAARVRLLGPFDIRLGAAGAAPGSARAEALFAYLVLHPETALPRERVASALWPGSTGTQARTNLRHLLHTVRSTVPELDHFVEITGRTLRWRPGAELWLDVAEYQKLLATEDDAARRDALRAAVALYGGELGEDGTTNGWWRSVTGWPGSRWTRWPSWWNCVRRPATSSRRPRTPSGCCGWTRCASRPTGR